MKEIPLTKGFVTLVDDEDFERVSARRWYAQARKSGKPYAVCAVRVNRGPRGRKIWFLHWEVLSPRPGWEIDHINGDPLDNRRQNLRYVTHGQNQQNCSRRTESRKGIFKGVCWHRQRQKWVAQIAPGGKHVHLGLFDSEEAAARAYDQAAQQFFGEFARLNFPTLTKAA